MFKAAARESLCASQAAARAAEAQRQREAAVLAAAEKEAELLRAEQTLSEQRLQAKCAEEKAEAQSREYHRMMRQRRERLEVPRQRKGLDFCADVTEYAEPVWQALLEADRRLVAAMDFLGFAFNM